VSLPILLSIIVVLLFGSGLGLLLWVAMKLIPQFLLNRLAGLTAWSKPFVQPVPLFLVSLLLGTAIVVLLFFNVVNRTRILLLRAQDLANVEQRPVLFLIAMPLLLATVGVYSLIQWRDAQALTPALRFTTRFSVGILALSLLWIATIAFNVHMRRMSFPLVMITDRQAKPESSTCGLLVYSTSKMLISWDLRSAADGPRGVISVRPRTDDVQLLVLGVSDVRDIAHGAVGRANPAITCGSSSSEQHVRAEPTRASHSHCDPALSLKTAVLPQ
jgi:hypothetical protein